MPATVPAVPEFTAGYGPLPADMDSWIQTPLSFCTVKTMFRGALQAAQNWTAATATLVQIGSTAGDILEDPFSGWSATATGSQPAYSWLCPQGCDGWYEITLTGYTTSPGNTTTNIAPLIYLNGSQYLTTADSWAVDGHASGACGGGPVPLTGATDYVQFYLETATATTAPSQAGELPTMEIVWIST
jgi:hypothetical protein